MGEIEVLYKNLYMFEVIDFTRLQHL